MITPGSSTTRKLSRNVSALSEARFHKSAKLGEVLCARSIEPFEPSRPWLRRTRDLCKLNVLRQRCRVAAGRCGEARKPTPDVGELAEAQNGCQESGWRNWNKGFRLRPSTEGLNVPKDVKDSSWRECFHAAAMTSGGERSRISAAVSLSMTFIEPSHLGQRQRSVESLVEEASCWAGGSGRAPSK